VYSVAVGADGGKPVPAVDGLAVDALNVLVVLRFMALAAGGRHIELEDGCFRIARHQDIVHSVAISTDSSFLRSRGDGFAMDTLFVGKEYLSAESAGLHHEFLLVTIPAGIGDVAVI
jgi:hypothetical protein